MLQDKPTALLTIDLAARAPHTIISTHVQPLVSHHPSLTLDDLGVVGHIRADNGVGASNDHGAQHNGHTVPAQQKRNESSIVPFLDRSLYRIT